ncbi:Autolysin [Dactylella cylindrospora]|nr:Autolysin [Dactylella cylindrospora]
MLRLQILVLGLLPTLVQSQWLEPPPGPADPNTVKTCSFWIIADESSKADCHTFASDLGLSWEQFSNWNPSVGEDCSGMVVGNAYCIEDNFGQPTTTTTSSSTTRTTTTSSGPTAPGPTQDGQDPSCISWEYIEVGQNCGTVLAKYPSLTLAKLVEWNPAIAVKGWVPPTATTTSRTTTTTPGNGISTPTPIQAGMVGNCNKFYFVKENDGCAAIASQAGIPLSMLYQWNPALNGDCSGLWANVYVCVGTTTYTPTLTTTTKPPTTTATTTRNNGVSTPTPIQAGMTTNCNKFYLVKGGDGCDPIARQFGISLSNFYSWNPAVKNDCSGLWPDYYVCVGLIGSTPTTTSKTTTTTAGGVVTPTPTQEGMIKNCKKFHFVQAGQTCEPIQKQYGVTLAQLYSWNPAIGPACQGMWAQTYLCVGV